MYRSALNLWHAEDILTLSFQFDYVKDFLLLRSLESEKKSVNLERMTNDNKLCNIRL